MRPHEIARFECAFYRVWTIGVMARAPQLQDRALAFLDECNSQELCRLDELANWAEFYNDNDFGSVGLDLRDDVWKAGYERVSKHWMAYLDARGHRGMAMPDKAEAPILFFAFFDHTHRFLDLLEPRKGRLSDL